jgi:hypothetical protein
VLKNKLTLILLILIIKTVDGQINKRINIPKSENGDTTLWYKWQHERGNNLKLQYLLTSTDTFHFRFWTTGQAVDIWTTDYKVYNGLITNHTDSYEYDLKKQERKPATTFSNQVEIDTISARQVFDLVKAISKIPSQDSIRGWGTGLDGISYLFETSTPTTYSFKSYWTPTIQNNSIVEAKQIEAFVEKIYSILNLKLEYDKFFSTLKPGSYTTGFIIMTRLTDKQVEHWKKNKPYKDYLDSVKDTLNNYLSDTLTKIFQKNGGLACSDQFFLKFSKNNKLKKITTNTDFFDFYDRMDYYKCRRKIRKAFRQVRIDFVHSKVGYMKELGYWDEKIVIMQ